MQTFFSEGNNFKNIVQTPNVFFVYFISRWNIFFLVITLNIQIVMKRKKAVIVLLYSFAFFIVTRYYNLLSPDLKSEMIHGMVLTTNEKEIHIQSRSYLADLINTQHLIHRITHTN